MFRIQRERKRSKKVSKSPQVYGWEVGGGVVLTTTSDILIYILRERGKRAVFTHTMGILEGFEGLGGL